MSTAELDSLHASMPEYRSHKTVRGLKIKEINKTPVKTLVELVPEKPEFSPFTVPDIFVRMKGMAAGWYYVVYENGYVSASPPDAFEDGYTQVEQEVLTSLLQESLQILEGLKKNWEKYTVGGFTKGHPALGATVSVAKSASRPDMACLTLTPVENSHYPVTVHWYNLSAKIPAHFFISRQSGDFDFDNRMIPLPPGNEPASLYQSVVATMLRLLDGPQTSRDQ